jgi:hypothetical protein
MGPRGGIGARRNFMLESIVEGVQSIVEGVQRRIPYRAPPEPSAARQREWKPDASPPGFFFRNIATMREVRV